MRLLSHSARSLLWLAWITFLASLVLPMERHSVAGPCAWPCLYPFIYTVGNNSLVFIFSPLLLVLNLLGILFTGDGFETVWLYIVYSAIGIGEILLLLAPVWGNRNISRSLGKSLLAMLIISSLAILVYALLPDLRYGIDALLMGYYIFLLSFLMMILGSLLNLKIIK